MIESIIVSAVIFNTQNKVAIGKRSDNDNIFPGLWGIPGGKIEIEPETTNILEKNIIREVLEEMGINISIIGYVNSNFNLSGKKLYIVFFAKHKSGKLKAKDETVLVGWYSLEECRKLKMTPHTLENIIESYSLLDKLKRNDIL